MDPTHSLQRDLDKLRLLSITAGKDYQPLIRQIINRLQEKYFTINNRYYGSYTPPTTGLQQPLITSGYRNATAQYAHFRYNKQGQIVQHLSAPNPQSYRWRIQTQPFNQTQPFKAFKDDLYDLDESQFETIKTDMPILAARRAHIEAFTPNGSGDKLVFRSLTTNFTFGKQAIASCNKHYDHTAPDLNCTCGFYAVPADKLTSYTFSDTVTLLVELSGKIIEHEEGFRAQKQQVCEVKIKKCGCGKPATLLLFDNTSDFKYFNDRTLSLASTCGGVRKLVPSFRYYCGTNQAAHTRTLGVDPISLTDLESKLGIPVRSW